MTNHKYTQEGKQQLLSELVEAISNGTPLAVFARERGVSRGTIYNWLNDDELVAAHIARAREVGYDALAGEILDIVDDCPRNSEAVAKAKMQSWARLQLLARWHKTKYGDQQRVEHAGDSQAPITIVTGVPQPGKPDLSAFGVEATE